VGLMSLEQACAAISTFPPAERAGASRALAAAVAGRLNDGPGWSVLDPLQCTPDRAAHCLSEGTAVAVGNQVCLSVLDRGLVCPFGARGGRQWTEHEMQGS